MIKALLFDVFGTVVNWRSGVIRDAEIIAKKYKINFDLEEFADKWRAEYQPSMEKIRTGKRGFVKLDFLHLENLEKNNILHSNKTSQSELSTGQSVIMVSPDAERTMCTYLGVSNLLSSNELNESAIKNSKYLFLYKISSEDDICLVYVC